jgi:serine/threonine protein phosphatase PrpC
MKQNKVVNMAEHEAIRQHRRKRDSRAILDECQNLAVEHLVRAFPAMMDKVDDALFDRVNQSENAADHSVYFDTMREMRLKRAEIGEKFTKRFGEMSEDVIKRVRGAGKDRDDQADGKDDGLELQLEMLDETALEESLAVTNMVSKIRGVCHEELFPLDKRMGVILGQMDLSEDDNPLGPQIICQAFHDACGVVQTSVEVKLIILKLFDIHVVSETQELYEAVNDLLAEKGVLPNIKRGVVKREGGKKGKANDQQPSAEQTASAGDSPTDAGDDTASAGLMNALQQVINANAAAGGGVSEAQAQARHTEVLGNLTALQQGNAPAGSGGAPIIDPALVGAGNTNVLRELKAANVTDGMGQVDVVMFDVVSMMFDFILDDDNVPDPMKALIGRLQIPMLKVALIDKAFFSKKSHPARKLLNTLSQAALGWNEKHDDGAAYYNQVENFVRKVLDEFEESIDVFGIVQEQLETFVSEQEQVAEESTKSSAGALENRERLEQARHRAHEIIAESFHGKPVPDVVQKFFHNRWKELLVFCHFDEGEDSDGWRGAVETMDQIVWSLSPISSPEDRKKLVGLLPGLLNRVKDGMKKISLPADERKQFLAALAGHHLAAVRAGSGDSEASPPAPEPATAPPEDAGNDIEKVLKHAVERANAVIHRAAESKPECAGMGTTLVAARFHNNRVTVAHVGDSRLYRLKNGELQQVTLDHSLMQDLINRGFYTPEEAKKNVKSNVITRAVGVEESVLPDVQEVEAEPGDIFLLCSDGLTDMVEDSDIQSSLQANASDLPTASETLVEMANRNGGKDNISVVLARVVEPFPAADRIGNVNELDSKIEIIGKTDVGRRRSHNEDGIAIDNDAGIAMVADGMGGCNAGEVASAMAVQIIMRALREELESADGEARAESEDELDWLAGAEEVDLDDLETEQATESVQQEFLDFVDELAVGNWLEFSNADGSKTRGRLAWTSAESGRFLFTDLAGAKVVDATRHALALEIQRNNVKVIEGEPLLERAMTTVTEKLESGKLESGKLESGKLESGKLGDTLH